MTIEQTIDQISAYNREIDTQLERLAEVPPPTSAAQPGADLLLLVFSSQLANAAERLNAVHQACAPAIRGARPKPDGEAAIEITDYRVVRDGNP